MKITRKAMDDRFAQVYQRQNQLAVAIGCLAEKAGITPADIEAWLRTQLQAQPLTPGTTSATSDKGEPVETPQEDSIGQ